MRAFCGVVVVAILLVARVSGSAARPSVGGTAPATSLGPAGATPFNPKAFDTFLPVEIGDRSGPQGGYPEKQLAAQRDAAVEAHPGTWAPHARVASPGT